MQKKTFEYRHILTLPMAKAYVLDAVLDAILAVEFPCKHHTPPTFYSNKWGIDYEKYNKKIADSATSNSVCDSCANYKIKRKAELIDRLLKLMAVSQIELWDLYLQRVEPPPLQGNKLWWATFARIFNEDLIKFCERERIRVEFEISNDQARDQTSSQLTIAEPATAELTPTKLITSIANENAISRTKDDPPGITDGMVAITKLAIKAAWEIECETGRKASARNVITKLQEWVANKEEEDLIGATAHGVKWIPTTSDEKLYDIDACRKTLQKWHKNRA